MRVTKRGETAPDVVRVGTGVRVREAFPRGAYTRARAAAGVIRCGLEDV